MSQEIQRWTVTEPYLKISGKLLEGPYYDDARNILRFVDIWNEKLYLVDLAKGPDSLQSFDTGSPIGVTASLQSGGPLSADENVIVVGAKHGFATVDTRTGKPTYIKKIWTEKDGEEKAARMRFNDGAVDSKGRFWAGAMNDLKICETRFEGTLFRLDQDLSLHRMIEDMGIPNGMNWNLADNLFYVTDSPTKNIYVYDFDAESGQISNRRVFFTFEGGADPDGFAMDEQGYLWVALYGGSKVVRISPEAKIVGEISLPAKCITCTEFAGTGLFITTAKDDDPAGDPHGGHLYKVDVGIRGKPRHKVILTSSP